MPGFNSGGSTSGPPGWALGALSTPARTSFCSIRATRRRGLAALRSGAGLGEAQSASTSDVAGTAEALASDESVVFEGIGVTVVAAEPDQRMALARTAADSPNVSAVERQRVVYVFDALSPDYLRGDPSAIHPGELVFHP